MYSSNCSGCYSGNTQRYSPINSYYESSSSSSSSSLYSLESRVGDAPSPGHSVERMASYTTQRDYHSAQNYHRNYSTSSTHTYHAVDIFLHPHRPEVQFIDRAEQIEQYVRDAFFLTTGKELPSNMVIHVLPRDELQKIHELNGGVWSNGILGFSMNSNGRGNNLIFIGENDLDRLMLVVGHEIGHVMSHTLHKKVNEEAKAFAFEMAWMKVLVEHNIANLRDNIRLDFQPAQNGLHDVAFGFVRKLMHTGKEALDIFGELVQGFVSVVG